MGVNNINWLVSLNLQLFCFSPKLQEQKECNILIPVELLYIYIPIPSRALF